MKVRYKGQLVVKISDTMVLHGNLLIQVKPEDLTLVPQGRCATCAHPATKIGYEYLWGKRVSFVCRWCFKIFCVAVGPDAKVGDPMPKELEEQVLLIRKERDQEWDDSEDEWEDEE
jgi:hypothetical protein